MKWYGCWGKQYGVPQKVNRELCDLATPLLAIDPKELKAKTLTDSCTALFIVPLFTVTKRWKQPQGPTDDTCGICI